MGRMTSLAAVLLAAVLAGGCNDDGATGPGATVPASIQSAYSSLGLREDVHHRAATDAVETGMLRGETARYAADMDSLIGAMMDSCTAMGTGGRMHGHDMQQMRGIGSGMGEVIHEHHARMDSLSTLDQMRTECDEHHDAMLERLGQMHDALPGGEGAGGGMMGGGTLHPM